LGRFFRINSPPVVAETLDGEATIVDLESGTYYALNESGTFVWEELGRGNEQESIPPRSRPGTASTPVRRRPPSTRSSRSCSSAI